MSVPLSTDAQRATDERLFGWDQTQGIVSVWADRTGRALLWRRAGEQVTCHSESFRPWLLATSLADLEHLREAPVRSTAPGSGNMPFSYRELAGTVGSYRYLLFARDGRTMEQELARGASKRLGRRINSTSELPNDYYRVGPVEQYLMLNGRVYFRGLNYEHIHRLQFDLETTSLDPHRGRIFLVAIKDSRGLATILEAPTLEDEPGLIRALCALIQERDPDVIENHNLFGFDLPFLEHRASVHDIPLALGRRGGPMRLEKREETLAVGPEARKRTRYSIPGRELIDTLDAVRRHDFVVRDMPSYGLKDVARYFGIASAERVYIPGPKIFETYRQNPALVRRYALNDVEEVDGLSCRLLGSPFALAGMAPRRYERLASAGPAMGVLEPILVRAYVRAGAALPCPAMQPGALGMHEGGAVHLFAAGVAAHVVKADVASLYPSLMRTFEIGPASDHLGVLLSILGRLTDLRLAHKDAARTALAGSIESNHHNATQAAMKILINSAYGYMGAGSMALFADSRAADEVTRRGREILNAVVASLRERSVALIEADTDGVYFAVPADWNEEQEQALVSEIGVQLPAGIRLEYEGRYRAMFSHEVKNYALLTYGDQLVVHGVALRSSRAEPFGERFLRQALTHLMTDDVLALRQCYLEMVDALRRHELPASDLGARVRLSKTPEAYQAVRATRPEPQYEALLNAGRTNWHPGERVRFYRVRGGRYVWLPEETEELPLDHDWQAGEQHAKQPLYADVANRRDYDVDHYIQALVNSYATRLRKAFAPEDFEQLFRLDGLSGLFDKPVESIAPRWIRCN